MIRVYFRPVLDEDAVLSAWSKAGFPLKWGTELFGPLLLTEEILEKPLDYSNFSLAVPTAPGLGITLDPDRLKHFTREGSRHMTCATE
jgi:muconate cycloisomerase